MNTPHSPHLWRLAAATGSLGIATVLALSGIASGGVQGTEAAYTDTDTAQAQITATWPEAFASVVAGSAKSATTMDNPTNMTYQSQFRWTSQLTQPPVTPTQENTSGWASHNRTWDQRYRGTGVAVNDWGPPAIANNLGSLDAHTLQLHDGNAVREFTNPGARTRPRNYRCLVIDETYGNASNRADCDLGNNFAAATNTTDAAGFSIGTGLMQFTYLNAAHLETGVRCGVNSAAADRPTGRIDFGQEASLGGPGQQNLDYRSSANPRTVWANGFSPLNNGAPSFPPAENTLSPMWTVQNIVASTHARVMPVITQFASPDGSQPYAISEIAAYIEVYRRAVAGASIKLHGKMYFVLSRSECGVRRTTDTALPNQRTVFPAELPGGNDLTTYTGTGFQPASRTPQQTAMRGLGETDPTTSTLPPATTVTSPLENTTASETTTSAPPDPDETNEATSRSTSTTSRVPTTTETSTPATAPASASTPPAGPTTTSTPAAPAIVIPDEPGTLARTARTEDVDTITAGGEELVVVNGDELPADARHGARALESWLGGGNPGPTWATYTSADPDEDGWRWAAINQETGTVVYIR